MCGIAGILSLDGSSVNEKELHEMSDLQKHRGPDSSGIYYDGDVGFAHRRLSIIDLTQDASQPMIDTNTGCCIVYNGEIYNYLELKKELIERGYFFQTRSDTEVILKAYEEWGPGCLSHLNGMFSFIIWHKMKKRLFAARDRFGVKPFYYYLNVDDGSYKKEFIFASEIKAILKVRPQLKTPNNPYLARFINCGILDDGEETFFEKIKQLLPAHFMIIDGGNIEIKRYWDFEPESAYSSYNYKEPEEQFRDLMESSIRLRLRSDVPVGTCLSGGLDSGSIVSIASKMVPNAINTFSSIYDDKDCDERHFIEIVNKYSGAQKHWTFPDGKNFINLLPRIIWHQDEPVSAPGIFSQWHVMELAQNNVKVLLDGQGGDELLGGYFHYYPAYIESRLKDLKANCAYFKRVGMFKDEMQKINNLTNNPMKEELKEGIRSLIFSKFFNNLFRLPSLKIGGNHKGGDGFFTKEFAEHANKNPIIRDYPVKFDDPLTNTLYWSLTRQSIPALLHYEDRNSMAFSIEARTPFLDYRLVEFGLGLPYNLKMFEDNTKYIMRTSLKGLVPLEILNRRDKKGYPTPVSVWFKDMLLGELREIIQSEKLKKRNIFSQNSINIMIEEHKNGTKDHSWILFRILTTEIWHEIFID